MEARGPYAGVPGVDPWDVARDARTYAGPGPVVAHPPCERWGRYARGGPNPRARKREVGDDGGCFEAALRAVRAHGGVIEHPAGSLAWERYGLPRPAAAGGWTEPDAHGGRACRVEQGHYGHAARKPTWLYAVLRTYPELRWGPSGATGRLELGPRSREHAKALRAAPGYVPPKRLTRAQRVHTPEAFRDVLVSMVREGCA